MKFKGFFHLWLGWYAIWYATGSWLLLDHSGHLSACKRRASALLVKAFASQFLWQLILIPVVA
ncbi:MULTISPECIES: hypothetical protein [Stenotrophomonas]|uniref:Uncharacterized protein n=1 Tax=Stenotrophomonas indicatrix TaxID=2045451 RepID=A0ABT8QBF5_9GAMM|nr:MULTISPECIES: hypothetical protein [Stenotrophomonas]MDN8661720.1 hypothetical protein [Stenotrophomonas indicatrix]MDN8668653.1 hypothetical protein [Stenotrophomonas indicatrix]